MNKLFGREFELSYLSDLINKKKKKVKALELYGDIGIGKTTLLSSIQSMYEGSPGRFIYCVIESPFITEAIDFLGFCATTIIKAFSEGNSRYFILYKEYKHLHERLESKKNVDIAVLNSISKVKQILGNNLTTGPIKSLSVLKNVSSCSARDPREQFLKFLNPKEYSFFTDPLPHFTKALLEDMQFLARNHSICLCIDRCELLNHEIGTWLSNHFINRKLDISIVLASRHDIAKEWNISSNSIIAHEIRPLTENETNSLLKSLGISNKKLCKSLYITSSGNLTKLNILYDVYLRDKFKKLDDGIKCLTDLFLQNLPDSLRKILRHLAIFRWFNAELIEHLVETDDNENLRFDSLFYIQQTEYGYTMEDTVRDSILQDLKINYPLKYVEWSRDASEYYIKLHDMTGISLYYYEYLYHSCISDQNSGLKLLKDSFLRAAQLLDEPRCIKIYEIALSISWRDQSYTIWIKYFYAVIERLKHNYESASSIFLEISKNIRFYYDNELVINVLFGLAVSYLNVNEYSDCLAYANKCINHKSISEYKSIQLRSMNIRGACLDKLGNFSDAIKNNIAVIKIAEENKDYMSLGFGSSNAGLFCWHSGDWHRAYCFLKQSIKCWQDNGHSHGECYPTTHLALLYTSIGNAKFALETLERGLKLCQETQNFEMEANVHLNFSEYYLCIFDYVNSLKHAKEGGARGKALRNRFFHSESLRLLALINAKQNNYSEALKHIEDALEIIKPINSQHLLLRVHVVLFKILALSSLDPSASFDAHRHKNFNTDFQQFPDLLSQYELICFKHGYLNDKFLIDHLLSAVRLAFSYNCYTGFTLLSDINLFLKSYAGHSSYSTSKSSLREFVHKNYGENYINSYPVCADDDFQIIFADFKRRYLHLISNA